MKNTYLSAREFETKCPYSFQFIGYAQSISSNDIDWKPAYGQKTDANHYTVELDGLSSHMTPYRLKLSCTVNSDGSLTFRVLEKSDNLQLKDDSQTF